METNELKRCTKCDLLLPINNFSNRRWRRKDANDPTGFSRTEWIYTRYRQCKKCINAKNTAFRKAHPSYWKEYLKDYITFKQRKAEEHV